MIQNELESINQNLIELLGANNLELKNKMFLIIILVDKKLNLLFNDEKTKLFSKIIENLSISTKDKQKLAKLRNSLVHGSIQEEGLEDKLIWLENIVRSDVLELKTKSIITFSEYDSLVAPSLEILNQLKLNYNYDIKLEKNLQFGKRSKFIIDIMIEGEYQVPIELKLLYEDLNDEVLINVVFRVANILELLELQKGIVITNNNVFLRYLVKDLSIFIIGINRLKDSLIEFFSNYSIDEIHVDKTIKI